MTSVRTAVRDARPDSGDSSCDPRALIAEAKRRRRDRLRRNGWLISGAAVAVAAVAASAIGLASRGERAVPSPPNWPLAAPTRPMPSHLVVWTGKFSVEVLSSRTGRVLRTLAHDVGLYQGLPTVAVSPAGVVYFDTARDQAQWIESTPLAGGPVTTIGPGDIPAISPDGRLLAYVAYTVKVYPPNTPEPKRDLKSTPEAIVVRNLATGTARRWSFTSDVADISSMSWSPGSRFLSFTSLYWTGGRSSPVDTTQVLDTRSGGTLTGARRLPLANGLEWAGFLTGKIGLAVGSHQQRLVAVAVSSGRVLRRLIKLPHQGLFASNGLDGTEGAITIDPSGHYVLIATAGPDGYGELFRWTVGTTHLIAVARGAIRAAWP